MEQEYINSILKQFENYKSVGEKTFEQLTDEDLFWQYHPECNSIAIIVNHLWGNMKSRWTDFLTSDGEKEWRQRDLEFESVIQSRDEMMTKWNDGWDCLFTALHSITPENFNTEVFIRNQSHSVMEAVNRQFAHYTYHIGQIVYVGRMIKGGDWKSLTIPRGDSTSFNDKMFSKGAGK
ncbi:DUF1572 domain-containing protein [Fulvivirga sp. 1062]|uniref:DUF1572 domain-containing protein n=2 Tax=Fulvivirga sedimenti TaxID=2879465 RepID=A0A9X1HMN2_9BACT|nr:DUF1572 family protein [Fulvivirga sedimenti]MCA6074276.1 DUF1572 domain-containing protein [Fulvivirga sedimenti]